AADDARLAALSAPLISDKIGRDLTGDEQELLLRTIPELKPRSKNINDLADGALFLFRTRPLKLDEKAARLLEGDGAQRLNAAATALRQTSAWQSAALGDTLKAVAEAEGLGLGKIAQPLRAALTGRTVSPGVFEMLELLGREESLARIDDQLPTAAA
ncbi:MAG: glutamate--tRNA ligase, partial [Pseudomonadota bacterium]